MLASLGRSIARVNFDSQIVPDAGPAINCLPGHFSQGPHSRVLHGLDAPSFYPLIVQRATASFPHIKNGFAHPACPMG